MQVQRIQSNNYNTSYKAKLTLSGFTNDIQPSEIQKLKEIAADIGTPKDSIDLSLSVPKITERYHRRSCGYFIAHRDIRATANINNKIVDDNTPIGYCESYCKDSKVLTVNTIKDYLNNLLSKQ